MPIETLLENPFVPESDMFVLPPAKQCGTAGCDVALAAIHSHSSVPASVHAWLLLCALEILPSFVPQLWPSS